MLRWAVLDGRFEPEDERLGGLAGRDGEEWWSFIAVGSFHGGLSAERLRAPSGD